MDQLQKYAQKAENSAFWNWILNYVLLRTIPFNKPHGFWVEKLNKNKAEISVPYKKSNFNHIRGIHACALATVSEYATGLLLLSNLDSGKYRIIMKEMNIQYFYQAKMDVKAVFELDSNWIQNHVIIPLENQDSIVVSPQISIYDTNKNHISTATIHWQIKKWDKVKTKV